MQFYKHLLNYDYDDCSKEIMLALSCEAYKQADEIEDFLVTYKGEELTKMFKAYLLLLKTYHTEVH